MRPPRHTAFTCPHSTAPLCFQLRRQILPRTLAIGSAENYTKRGLFSPGEAGCLLPAAGGGCQLAPFYFTLQLLHLFLASPASAAAAPVHSQRTLQAFLSARGARRRRPQAAHTNLSKMQSPRAPERNRQRRPQHCLGEGKHTQRLSAGGTAALRRQEPFLPPELLQRPRLPQTDADCTCAHGGGSSLPARLAAARTRLGAACGYGAALGLGQLQGASGAGRGSGELWRVGEAPGQPRAAGGQETPAEGAHSPQRRPRPSPGAPPYCPPLPSSPGTAHALGADGAPEAPDAARARRAAGPRFGHRGAAAARGRAGSSPGAAASAAAKNSELRNGLRN